MAPVVSPAYTHVEYSKWILSGFCFCHPAEDLIAGKRVYLTASTAREHSSKLWEQEGRTKTGLFDDYNKVKHLKVNI